MRIGVLTLAQHSMFSSGLTNTSLAVAELMRMLGHDVEFIQVGDKVSWWDDCKTLEKSWKMVSVAEATGYDLIFEIDRLVLTAEKRRKVATQSVWIIRKPFILQELEASLFPTIATPKREFEGLKEIWMMDAAAIEEGAVQIVELLSRVPVRLVPFLWTASIANTHQQEMKLPHWLDSTASFLKTLEKDAKMPPWNVHIAETNTTNASSATLPLVILREAKRRNVNIGNWKVHNADVIVKSKFFIDNIVRHCSDAEVGLSGEFVGRQRCVEWSKEPLSCVLSHMRFSVIRPMLLDLAWAGVPVVHNSPILRDIGCGLENYYYSDNHVGEAADALRKMDTDFTTLQGMFRPESLKEVTLKLITTFTSLSTRVKSGWSDALKGLGIVPSAASLPVPIPKSSNVLRVGFCDMWDDFVPEYNFFILMLSAAGQKMGVEVIGGPATPDSSIVIFGPFGSTWKTLPEKQPKIHFTGENTAPVKEAALNLGYQHVDMVDNYLRFPLWILEIDWFGADPARIVNPKPIPLERCTKVYASELAQKKKFCAFIVTNPLNPIRNSAFQWLSEYKTVDSAGRLFNNIGPDIFAGTGGGGGELKKLEFLKDYKFCLTYENNSAPGYVTEKYLHAKAAGCIPIYWGDPRFEREFNKAGCINAQNFKSPEELIEAVRRVDEDDSEWLKRFAVPALDPYRVSWAQRTMAECAKRIFALGGFDVNSAPEVIGDVAPVAVAPVGPANAVAPVAVAIETPLMVTYATRKYLPSLQHWLVSISTQVGAMPDLKAIVFLSSDVPEDTGAALKEKFPFATFENVPDKVAPPGAFADFWHPQHFGWKIWIYNELSGRKDLAGKMIFYIDAGGFLCRWPKEWMMKAQESGICFLEDPRQENKRWCSPDFCSTVKVTETELAAQQIIAGVLLFRAGAPAVVELFKEAMELAKDRKVLVGPKWAGTENGKPFGHRHDQSILSILSLRHRLSRYPLDNVYCDSSLRKTFTSGRAVYIHRGNFKVSVPFTEGISEAYVINLARRADRMERLSPALRDRTERWDAVDGRDLELTPALQRLLKPNDFFWKKAVTGCAMSHLGLWCKLAQERPDIDNYLIMEDDVKFRPDWENVWKSAVDDIPDDYDIIYLGGVLPPNRAAFEGLKERVNDSFCRVKENMMWGQKTPTRYFHFCAYAYILTRAGAAKVIKLLEEHDGFWTSADHVLCNPVDVLKAYVLDPMIAGCYQDDDPKYANSQFNDFSRIDGFDSDLWNNDERFVVPEKIMGDLDILDALTEVRAPKAVPLPTALDTKAVPLPTALDTKAVPLPTSSAVAVAPKPVVLPVTLPSKDVNQRRFVALSEHKLNISQLYEGTWLQELFGRPTTFVIEPVRTQDPPPTDSPIFIIQRPYIEKATALMEKWNDNGATFSILHMSDEIATDDISSYDLSGCLSVLRFYQRPNLPKKVMTIPLGFHWTLRYGPKNMLTGTPRLPFRSLTWSFFGTDWKNRKSLLDPLYDISGSYKTQFFKDWNDSHALDSEAYTSALMDTIFVPCPDGVNPETFRFYEALECGCIPLIVATEENAAWVDFITEHIQILPLKSWEDAAKFVTHLKQNIEMLEVYRVKVLSSWIEWRKELQGDVKAWSKVGAQ
jgi:GR25 family glycosyltransferase involved in LPS biosynthesis